MDTINLIDSIEEEQRKIKIIEQTAQQTAVAVIEELIKKGLLKV